jgi:hypothetical protein
MYLTILCFSFHFFSQIFKPIHHSSIPIYAKQAVRHVFSVLNIKWLILGIVICSASFISFQFASQFAHGTSCFAEDKPNSIMSPTKLDSERFRLHIKVLTYDRIDSLLRCLNSLENALYGGDTVSLVIYVDHAFDSHQNAPWDDASSQRISVSHASLKQIDDFNWSHGDKSVHYRVHNVGMQPQWLEAWWPESFNDFAFIVEDDMEVSPLYYRYFKKTVLQYYYEPSQLSPNLYGASLQRQTLVPGKLGPLHSISVVYLILFIL